MKKIFFTVFLVALLIAVPGLGFAQTVVNVVSDLTGGTEGNLNKAIQAAITANKLSTTLFRLEAYGYYILTGTISVPAGQTLNIEGAAPGTTQATAPPQIVWSASGSPDTRYNFSVSGNISLKNVWLMYANATGAQVGSSLSIVDDPLAVNGQSGTFENVIFSYSPCPGNASGSVSVECKHFRGIFKNCYWKNCIDSHLKYYGRAVSYPFSTTGWHSDSLTFENCTFANMGYVVMQEADEYADYIKMNHCTFLDIVEFALEQGRWYKLSVTNCLFVNSWMEGYIPAQGDPGSAIIQIDSVATFSYTVPWTEQDRRILFANSANYLDQWIVDWMGYGPNGNPYSKTLHQTRKDTEIPAPRPMIMPRGLTFFDSTANGKKVFPYMNRFALIDSVNPGFIAPPTDTGLVKAFLYRKWNDNSDTNWAWRPYNDISQTWPLVEKLSYTNTTLQKAGMGGFPLGDLYHWWPTQYTTWAAQASAENTRLNTWLSTGKDPPASDVEKVSSVVPQEYMLGQNYPNPFNPTTRVEYSVPLTGHVSLRVFNALGQEVATLFDGTQNPGKYVATFDGKGLTSGVYFYRLQSGTASITQKLILMK